MKNYFLVIDNLVVLIDETSMHISSVFSDNKELAVSDVIKLVSFKSSIQYSVSLDSFKAILNLLIKSNFDWANSASRIKAPIAVPDFNNCFDNTNSFCSVMSCL